MNKEEQFKKVNKKNEEQQTVRYFKRVSQKNKDVFYIKSIKGALYILNVCVICSKYTNTDVFITSLFVTLISFGVSFFEKKRDKKYDESIVTRIGYIYPMLVIFLLTMLQIMAIISLQKIPIGIWKLFSFFITVSLYIFVFLDYGFIEHKNKKGAGK